MLLRAILGLLAAGAAVLLLWLVRGAGDSVLRQAVAFTVWGAAAVAVRHFWRHRFTGMLQWNGLRWHLEPESLNPASHPLDAELRVCLDLQVCLWVCVDSHIGRGTWLWLERKEAPERWGDLRRAVYSRPRPESPGALPGSEPEPQRSATA